MATNLYDEALETLEEQARSQAARPVNPYLETLEDLDRQTQRHLKIARRQAAETTPDQAADADRIARASGLSQATVLRNYPTLAQHYPPRPIDDAAVSRETPHLAQWASQPDNAAVAQDDMEQLGLLEWLMTAPQRAKAQGDAQVEVAMLQHQALFRTLSPAEQQRLTIRKADLQAGGELGGGASWFRGAVVGSARQIPNYWGALLAGGKLGIPAGVAAGTTAAVLGQLGPQAALPEELLTVPGMFWAGARAGLITGAAQYTFQLESGLAYDEFSNLKVEGQQAIDPDVAKAAALAAGAINGGLEVAGLGVLLKTIPGAKMLTGALTRDAIKQALRNTTVRAALLTAVKEYGGALTGQVAEEVAQRAVTILAGELGKVASGQTALVRRPGDIASDLWQEGAGAVQSMALLTLPGPTLGAAITVRQARQAQHNVDFFTALGEGVTNSKAAKRSPQRVQAFLQQATADGPIDTLYAPTDTWIRYWQSQGLDPAGVARELTGISDALEQAIEGQRDLVIPTAAYATRLAGTPHNAALMQELRLGPDEMNAREGAAYLAEEEAKSLAAAQLAREGITTATPEATAAARAQQVIHDRLVAAGVPEETAQTWSTIFRAGIGQMAADVGVAPDVLQGRYGPGGGPTITREGLPPPAAPVTPAAPVLPGALGAEFAPVQPIVEPPPEGDFTDTAIPPAAGVTPAAPITPGLDEPIAAMQNIGAAALRMIAENPDLRRAAEALRARGLDRAPATSSALETVREELRPATGEGRPDVTGEYVAPDVAGGAAPGGEGAGAQRGRLPTRVEQLLAGESVFARADPAADAARLTPAVTRELDRIATELREFPFVARTWSWLDPNIVGKPGTAAGGAADIIAGGAGSPVYDDILAFAPANKGTKGQVEAQIVRGTRAQVEAAVRKTLETGIIQTNLAEGAVRVAERRATDDYRELSPPILPPSWGEVATPELLAELDAQLDEALGPADLLVDESALTEAEIAQAGEGATSFDVTEFEQGGLYDQLADSSQPPGIDVLTTKDIFADARERRQQRREQATALAAPGTPITLQHPSGRTALAGSDMSKPGTFRLTRFEGDQPIGHTEHPTLVDAITVGLEESYTPPLPVTTAPGVAPTERSAYEARAAYDARLAATYFLGEEALASSRTTPQRALIPPVGSWLIDETYRSLDGSDIEQLVEVPIDQLEISEDTGRARFGDVEQYARWLKAGIEPPPIRVVQTDRGTLKTLDHRRLLAAKAIGADTIKGWVSWATPSTRPGAPIVGLTYELAAAGAQPIATVKADPANTIFSDDARLLEELRTRLAAEGVVDVLPTGEVQPRLPGEVGAVRAAEIATPTLEAPFALTPEVAPGPRGRQQTLFQSAYHGSPHVFDRFSLQHIGSGEGAQAYGWGLYFASQREIAEYYRDQLSARQDSPEQRLARREIEKAGSADAAAASIRERIEAYDRAIELSTAVEAAVDAEPFDRAALDQVVAERDAAYAAAGEVAPGLTKAQLRAGQALIRDALDIIESGDIERGRLYRVEIPEDDDLLDWDRPASEQSPKVQAALRAMGVEWTPFKTKTLGQMRQWFNGPTAARLATEDIGIREALQDGFVLLQRGNEEGLRRWQTQHQGLFQQGNVDPLGEQIYRDLHVRIYNEKGYARTTGSPMFAHAAKLASQGLNAQGIVGIRYLDGASRAAGEGAHNYVIFDDQLVQITEYSQSAVPLTAEALRAWEQDMLTAYGPALSRLSVDFTQQGDLGLTMIGVDRGAQRAGVGTAVMTALTRLADLHGLRITLTPAQRNRAWGTTSHARLVRFYRRFGFVENSGRRKDFSISAGMYREPTLRPMPPAVPAAPAPVQTETPAFRAWFKESQVVDEEGDPLVVYHGSSRLDRVGPHLFKKRATSGPMLFFTASPEIASRYAEQKADTSLEREDENVRAYEAWFRVRLPDSRTAVNLDRAWWALSGDDRARIAALAPRVTKTDEGELALGPPEHKSGTGGYDQHIREARGNHFAALIEEWLNSGNLFGDEQTFLEVLQLAGVDVGTVEFHDPEMTRAGVLPVYLSLQNPLDTAAIPDTVIAALEARARRSRGRPREFGADPWDKLSRDLRDWVAQLKADRDAGVNSFVWSSIPDAVTEELTRLGYDGIRDRGGKTGGVEHDVWIPFEPTQIKSAIGNIGTFDPTKRSILRQAAPSERRGAIRFGPERQFDIALFERADLSTFLHETGHFFLEVFGDLVDELGTRDPATLTPEQRAMQTRYATLLEWLQVKTRSEIGVDQHEQFARGFEAYLFEGTAPSLELREVFSTVRAWLLGIYRALRGLNVQLTPEVRQVFDRLLASEAQIAQAEAQAKVEGMFLTPEAAGMTPERFALYRAKVAGASTQAREELDKKLMAEVQREQGAQWKGRRGEIEAEVRASYEGQPIYRAFAAIRRGTNPDGTPLVEGMEAVPLRLSRTMLVDRYGKDRLKRLPPLTYSREGGLDPDVVAQQFGFSSGDELLLGLEQAEPLEAAITRTTDTRMLQEHGALLLDGTVHEAARAAVANEQRDLVLREELRALAQLRRVAAPFEQAARTEARQARRERDYERRWFEAEAQLRIAIAEGRKQVEIDALTAEVQNLRQKARGGAATIRAALPPAAAIRDIAKTQIARLKIRDIRPLAYWAAARQAAAKATAAAARQDFDTAIEAKQGELLNLQLYREATRALEDVATRVRFAKDLGKPTRRAQLGLAGESYTDQVDGILDRYEFAKVSAKVLERRANVRDFVAGLEGEGLPIDLPVEVLNDARRINYQEITVEELVGITDGLKQILHLARLKLKLLRAQEQRELEEVAGTLAASIRDNVRRPRREVERDRRASEERRRLIEDWFAGHRKLASILRELDGFADGGPAWDAFMRPLNEAAAREAEMMADATERLSVIVEAAFPGREKRRLYEKRRIDAVNRSLSRMERITIALNWGNAGNRDRIRRSEGWTDAQVRAILDTLTAGDLQFVQGIFDFVNSYWPAIAEKQTRVYGVAPEKVEALPIVAAAGEIAGGYYPLKYDDRLSAAAIGHLDLEAANLARNAAYTQATTKRGHTEARQTTGKQPVRYDFGVLFEHVGQVIHDLTHHEALIDVGRILGHAEVQAAILETKGDVVYKQIRGTIRDVAFGDVPARTGFERAINHTRMGVTIAMLGWNVTTSLLQPMGLFNSVVRIGPRWVAKGIGTVFRDPRQIGHIVAEVLDKSAFMRARGRTQQREINEIRTAFNVNTGTLAGWVDDALSTATFDRLTRQGIADSYFWMIQQMQRVADVPTWIGAYEKAKAANEAEDRAIALADQAVLDSQGGGQIKDLAEVQRGGPMLKLWTNFYSYFNVLYNQATESTRRTHFKQPAEVGRLAADYLMLFIVPAVVGKLIRDGLRPGDEDEDDATSYAWEVAAYMSGIMLGVREVSGALSGYYGYEGPAGARAFATLSRLGQQARQGEPDAAFLRALWETGGIILHYPAGQAWKTITGIAALEEGRTENPAAVISGAPKER